MIAITRRVVTEEIAGWEKLLRGGRNCDAIKVDGTLRTEGTRKPVDC